MLLGHFGVAFAAKRVAPRSGLLALAGAAMFLDFLWPLLLVLGLENLEVRPGLTAFSPLDFHFTYSHSLVMAIVWSVLVGVLYATRTRYATGALWVGLLVFSHWVLDWITHRPDMPLWPGGPVVGLGLWNSVRGTIAVEVPIYAIGFGIYLTDTRAKGGMGHLSLWSLAIFAVFMYVSGIVGPPPPNAEAVRWVALTIYLLLPWFWWIDRTRETRRA